MNSLTSDLKIVRQIAYGVQHVKCALCREQFIVSRSSYVITAQGDYMDEHVCKKCVEEHAPKLEKGTRNDTD